MQKAQNLLESVEVSFSRGLHDLRLKQAFIVFFLGLHVVVAYALFGWGSPFFEGHDFQNLYFYVSLFIYGFNVVELFILTFLKSNFTSTKQTNRRLLFLNYALCIQVFLDGNLVYCTEPVFLLVGFCVFTLRIRQVVILQHITNSLEVCSETHLVDTACNQPRKQRNKILVALFDLRRTNLRSVVAWSLVALSYNFASNLWCLVSTPRHTLPHSTVESIVHRNPPNTSAFNSTVHIVHQRPVYPLLRNEKKVPRPISPSGYHCVSLPVVFSNPISRENNLKGVGTCDHRGVLSSSTRDFGFGHGFNLLSRENAHFMGSALHSNQCPQKPWQPPCDDHECSSREVLPAEPHSLFWYVPVSSPTQKWWGRSEEEGDLWYTEQSTDVSGKGWGWVCGDQLSPAPNPISKGQPLEWLSSALLFWSEQARMGTNRSATLLLTATRAAFHFPYLIYYSQDIFFINRILYNKGDEDCAEKVEFWCFLMEALRILHSETFFLERDLLHFQDEGCQAPVPNSTCAHQWTQAQEKVHKIAENWRAILNQMAADVLFRNVLLTLYMGCILILKAYELLRKYILVGYRSGLRTKNTRVLIAQNNSTVIKTRTTDTALLESMHVLRSLNRNVALTVLGSFVFILFSSLAVVSASTQVFNTSDSLFPTYGWVLNARVLEDGEIFYREPFVYFFLLLFFSFLTAGFFYFLYAIILRPLFFLLFWHRLKTKLRSINPQGGKKLRKYIWPLYLRTTALLEGLCVNVAIVLGWISQSWYTSPWPWKYTPWYFVRPQTWNMTFFINCVFLPVVSVFAINYLLECSVYETLFWSRIEEKVLVLEEKVHQEEVETLLSLEEGSGSSLTKWFRDHHTQKTTRQCFLWQPLAWRCHNLNPEAEDFIANLLIAHTIHLQFGEHSYHGKHSLFSYRFVEKHLEDFRPIHRTQLSDRSCHLQGILEAHKREYARVHSLKLVTTSKLVKHLFEV